ncbi:MAG: hypothetical protein E6K81_15620 [Candidatus Eisenbacteria bacterium]|uniref:Uncharacterized protein n=1 Tax=Eiseniibacteriota bacterium TaxID=2212470 RepID=A0A538TZQ9_UNCEI|nr:MAG: hypothetical protein E6K81_15620 [Candidatus Eisenbacteria bacterium]
MAAGWDGCCWGISGPRSRGPPGCGGRPWCSATGSTAGRHIPAVALLVLASGAGVWAAWLAALAFAAMPAHAECVAWISGRTDIFCALFGLAALWLDARARRAGRPWPGALAALALALALLSKESGVPLVGVLVGSSLTSRSPRSISRCTRGGPPIRV